MNWLTQGFGRLASLPEGLAARLRAWESLPDTHPETPFALTRIVVVDCETSGLAAATDRLLSIGAVALDAMCINLADGFDTVLRQAQPSGRHNILIHGIGAAEQEAGEDPCTSLTGFLEWSAKAPLIAYHAPFDAAFIGQALRQHLGPRWARQAGNDTALPWIDLAAILPLLFDVRHDLALDHWLQRFGIEAPLRHTALGDALATAQLAQVALRKAESRGLLHFAALKKLTADSRWLAR